MTDLQKAAAKREPMNAGIVERIYYVNANPDLVASLCESHERLRSLLAAAEARLREAEAERVRAVAAERERCLQIVDGGFEVFEPQWVSIELARIADAIRGGSPS